MKAFCSQCKQIKEVYYTIEVDGVPHHFCADCQRSQKAEFMQKLADGDPKATEIMRVLSRILRGKGDRT